jgi:hypothetical protein
MMSIEKKRALRTDLIIAAVLVGTGLAITGVSLTQLESNQQLAQVTHPLQSTPGAETKPSAPPEPTTTGTRPNVDTPPQPARPDADAVDAGARRALPPAPAEKTGDPIPTR